MARRLGIDYGEKRMGVAVCDPGEIVATPLCVVQVRGDAQAADEVRRLAAETGAEAIVIGLPLNMNNTRGPQALKVEAFAERVRTVTGLPVELCDERLSTAMMERSMIDADVRREKRKTLIDMLAAQTILQTFLDRRQGSA